MKQNVNQESDRKSIKRKLADAFGAAAGEEARQAEIKRLVGLIKECYKSGGKADRSGVRKACHSLSEFCKQDEHVDAIVAEGAIDAVVPLLSRAKELTDNSRGSPATIEDVEKEACFILGLLAIKPEHQQRIASADAISSLVGLLTKYIDKRLPQVIPSTAHGVCRRASDAITNLAHENLDIKNMVREKGGIPPLVSLLESMDIKVQRASAGALRTLAFKNEDNKNQIVEAGALPTLIQMLRSEDTGVHYEAVGVIGNLVHSSPAIKRRVLEEGALQPVIHLLRSTCSESQREAALLLGQFATASNPPPNLQAPNPADPNNGDYKAKICQRGAIPPLIAMLGHSDQAIKEMAAFAIGRLAQQPDNQAGVVAAGGLKPLLDLLESKHYNLQHNAAFALYGLAENEDNIPDIIKEGGLQRLLVSQDSLAVQASKDCVGKTIARIQLKLEQQRVLAHVVYMMRSSNKEVQRYVATSMARLAPTGQLKSIFCDKNGLDILLDMLTAQPANGTAMRESAQALLELAKKVNTNAPIETIPQPSKTVYLGEQYVNNKTLADVTFIVEGREFYAHRIALLASSDHFRAMFGSGFGERDAAQVPIQGIEYDVFEAMMRYIYTGSVEINPGMASELLQASDLYLLEGLKRLCEATIAQNLSVENLFDVFNLSETFSAPQLGKRCVLFALEHFDEVVASTDHGEFAEALRSMLPLLKESLLDDLKRPQPAALEAN